MLMNKDKLMKMQKMKIIFKKKKITINKIKIMMNYLKILLKKKTNYLDKSNKNHEEIYKT